jgi:hypothetical protein
MYHYRLATVDQIAQYQGEFFSKEWVMKNVLRLSGDEIKAMAEQIDKERAENPDEEEI